MSWLVSLTANPYGALWWACKACVVKKQTKVLIAEINLCGIEFVVNVFTTQACTAPGFDAKHDALSINFATSATELLVLGVRVNLNIQEFQGMV